MPHYLYFAELDVMSVLSLIVVSHQLHSSGLTLVMVLVQFGAALWLFFPLAPVDHVLTPSLSRHFHVHPGMARPTFPSANKCCSARPRPFCLYDDTSVIALARSSTAWVVPTDPTAINRALWSRPIPPTAILGPCL